MTAMKSATRPQVLNYSDYRLFLQDSFHYSQKKNPQWSYEAWAHKLELQSNTSLLKIINGQREAGKKIQDKLVEYFGFNDTEAQYFNDLVELSKLKANYEKAREAARKAQRLCHELEEPEDSAVWSEKIKGLIAERKLFRVHHYIQPEHCRIRSLVQFTKEGASLCLDYFQEHLVLRNEDRSMLVITHFVRVDADKFDIYCENAPQSEVRIHRNSAIKDRGVTVTFCSDGYPTFSTHFYSLDDQIATLPSTLQYTQNWCRFEGSLDRVHFRLDGDRIVK